MPVEIRQIPLGGPLKDFLDVVDYIYKDDPYHVRPLDMLLKEQLSAKNPFFEHAEGTLFTAYRNGWCVGRCSAQIDRAHLTRYKDDVGCFGFFDTIDDVEVARALIDSAKRWLGDRGMRRIRGPLSLSTNETLGCLVGGFDSPPMLFMAHHQPYQGGLIEQAGLEKEKDLFAWTYQVGSYSKRVERARLSIEALPEVTGRHVNVKKIEQDVRIVMDIYNDAWSDNWGYVPLTENELRQMAKDMKLLLDPRLTYIAYINGEPAAVALAVPNLNEAIADLGGKLFPLGAPKLLYRLKVKKLQSARLIILGIRKKFRSVRKYAALSLYLYAKMNDFGYPAGYRRSELSWTLEDNGPVNVGIKTMGGRIYKTYRIYDGAI
jgi:hypothetical protein